MTGLAFGTMLVLLKVLAKLSLEKVIELLSSSGIRLTQASRSVTTISGLRSLVSHYHIVRSG